MSDINIFYSTPSCYLKSVYLHGRRDKTLYTEMNDHLPYGSDINTYWTGFYSSRPSFKYLVKRAHAFLQVVKQLSVLSRMKDSYELHLLRHAIGLVLHHDAITGTSQQHVANDFIKILTEAVYACTKKLSLFLSVLTPTWGGRRSKNNQQFVVCHQLNISQCRFTETQDSLLLLVYNPSSVKTYHHIRFPVLAMHYSIKDYNNEEVEHQLVPLPTAMINLPGRSSTALQELCFEAENIPPLGFTTYYITSVRDQLAEGELAKKAQTTDSGAEQERLTSISNEYIRVTINKTTGFLESIQHVDGVKITLSQNWYYYSQTPNTQYSGAYSFRPAQDRPVPVSDKAIYTTIRGTLVKEIRQRFSDWITQITRLYRGEEFVEIEWIIGPVPIDKDLGKEVVTIFKTNVTNNGIFYTDSNGRQMMQRNCLNQTAGGTSKCKLPSCFYPVGKICIENSRDAFCVLTDRSQGGTSYNDGEIELMVHRRLLTDDTFGLEESLNEEEFGIGLVVRGKHRIFVGNHRQDVDDLSFFERVSQMYRRWSFEPWLFMTQGEKISKRKWQNVRNKRYTGLRLHGLPHHIHILTLEPWKGGSVLLRLENTLEKSQDDRTSSTSAPNPGYITVDLRKLFLFIITKVEETTLGANQWLQQARQMDWSSRYVYNGGDDGILPEDNPDYVDELRMSKEDKEPGLYSEEIYPKSSNLRQTRNKKKENGFDNESRRKRFVNVTDNIRPDITTDRQDIYNNNNKNNTIDNQTLTKHTIYKNKKSSKRLSFLKSSKPSLSEERRKNPKENSREDESSFEDFSRQKKKRGYKKENKTSSAYEVNDDYDDGVTRSIYEMYYKTKSRRKSFKPYLRGSEGHLEDSRIEHRSDEANFRRMYKDKTYLRRDSEDYSEESKFGRRNHDVTSRRMLKHKENLNSREELKRRSRNDYSNEYTTRNYKLKQYNVYSRETGTRNNRKLIKDSDKVISRSKRRKISGLEVPYISDEDEEELSKLRYTEKFGEEYDEEHYQKEDTTNRGSRHQRRREYINVSHQESSLEMNEESLKNRRIKRSTNMNRDQSERLEQSEQTEQPEQEDYIITLRSTQIRTFIIWFQDKKHAV